jgi:UDP-GlcNAc3NAcA epimerase
VVVYGDTNTTLAASLVAAKMDVPLAHVEAGLRSFDRRMPEEVNRVVTDHLARWSFAPTDTAVANLAAEGLSDGVHLVGDVMRDLAARTLEAIRDPSVLGPVADQAGVALQQGRFLFATVHRAENRSPDAIRGWVGVLEGVARADRPVLLALHPGTRAAMDGLGIALDPSVVVIDPLGYRSSLAMQLHAAAVLTDSGGVQREAAWLGTPCLVLRGTTEWVETLEGTWASSVLVGLDAMAARAAIDRLAPAERAPTDADRRARERTIDTDGATASIARLLA